MDKNETGKTAEELLAEEVTCDFLKRQEERRYIERGWQLNMNFVGGRQYCDINSKGELYEEDKKYFWQTRRVFNHVAPTVDTRCSKLGRIRPALAVRPASDDENDRHSAALASAILAAKAEEIDGAVTDATIWSETCGTAFYKIIWDGNAGGQVGFTEDGKRLNEGDAVIHAVSPFEIYPYTLSGETLEEQPSIIHAKVMPVQDIFAAYGVKLAGRDISEFSLSPYANSRSDGDMQGVSDCKYGYELVIERYERASEEFPQGRLTAVAGGVLLFDGVLPYVNGENGRTYPFIKQTSLPLAGSFFGTCIVDRLIPLQRAYNAVKNRKHEFLNRISMGTVAVEDGSVDVDELLEDGLTPGKVIIYRQGSKPPEMLTLGSVPSEFGGEEEKLLAEFTKVSGTGNLTDNADSYAGITSATGLQLIIEQDEMRMEYAYRQIKKAMKCAGRQILRLYRQFATDVRLLKLAGANNVLSLYYFKGSDISSDDVFLEADNDCNLSTVQKRSGILEILEKGLFSDGDGKLTASVKNRILEMLGYKSLCGGRDLSELNRARAGEENLAMLNAPAEIRKYDEHETHISEHTAFLLTEKLSKEAEERICAHIDMHARAMGRAKSKPETEGNKTDIPEKEQGENL